MASQTTGDSQLDDLVSQWMSWDKNAGTRQEIESLLNSKNHAELKKVLCNRMEFGTAGLRAPMGAGFSKMNDLTIIQTSQGFVKYMLSCTPSVKDQGVVIGFDGRHNSKRFAELSANVFCNENIPVYLFADVCPTPFVPFAVRKLKTSWGIMVTASHNPKQDNGYKVYFENGAQIISPHDKGIAQSIEQNLQPLEESWKIEDILNRIKEPTSSVFENYLNDIHSLSFTGDLNQNTPLKFTYTAMHGVGYRVIVEAFKKFKFRPLIGVKEQIWPDPEFPTVVYPNPEEGKSALDLAMKTADENNSTIILANDPDADRLALAEKQPSGSWKVFSGNETGALLGWWLSSRHALKPGYKGQDVYTLASTVSSKILRTISAAEGFNFVETLTGFKWMGNKSYDLMQQGKTVIFAFEEAIGFMCGTTVLDKDGISAAVVCAEMAVWLNQQNLTVTQQLDQLYRKYGYHVCNNSYFICHEAKVIKQIFERMRDYEGSGKYPSHCGPHKIQYIRDLTTGYDNSQPENKAILPTSKSSQMITFTFENGCIATIRTSGTEPKIKYYSEMIADPKKGQTKEQVTEELNQVVTAIIEHFYEPQRNNLTPRST